VNRREASQQIDASVMREGFHRAPIYSGWQVPISLNGSGERIRALAADFVMELPARW
jgi:hypothetical protein